MAELGERLYGALRSGTTLPPLGDIDLEQAYAASRRMLELRLADGETLIGKKIGVTSPAVQNALGVFEPDYGFLTDRMQVERVDTASLIQPRSEAELAFKLSRSLRGPGITEADVLAAVETVHPCFEIVDSRIEDWRIRIQDTVADNASAGVFVLGEGVSPEGIDFLAVEVTVEKNGHPLSSGRGADVAIGGPLACVAWLANKLGSLGVSLNAGEIVLSGSLVPLEPVAAGDHMRLRFPGIGSLEVHFD